MHARPLPSTIALILLPSAVVIAVVLGYIGYACEFGLYPCCCGPSGSERPRMDGDGSGGRPQPSGTHADALYRSLQLMMLQSNEPPGAVRWQVDVARFIAAVTLYSVVLVYLLTVLGIAERGLVRLIWRDHVVVCGFGEIGRSIASDLRGQGVKVVVVEREAFGAATSSRRAGRTIMMPGDARDERVLRGAAVPRARALVVACGSDDENLAVALRAGDVCRGRRSKPLLLCPHLVDHEVRDLLRDRFAGEQRRFVEVNDFSAYELAARALLAEHPLDRVRIGPASRERVHLVLIGFGRPGQAVLRQALRIGHFANGRLLKVSIFDRAAEERWACFQGRHPNLLVRTLPDIADIDLEEGDIVRGDARRRLDQIVTEPEPETETVATIVVSVDSDIDGLRIAGQLPESVALRGVPVCVRMRHLGGVASLMRECRTERTNDEPPRPRLVPFGQIEELCTLDRVVGARQDMLARLIHRNYLDSFRPDDPAARKRQHRDWADLDEAFRDSNRQVADFIPVLLRAFGYRLASATEVTASRFEPIDEFPPEELEVMARMEHARWYAERYLAGWSHAPQRNDFRRQHDCMVPWERLSEPQREKDRSQIRDLFRGLRSARGESQREAEFVVRSGPAA